MGKMKNKKFKVSVSNPIGAEIVTEEQSSPEQSVVNNLLDKIQSTHSEEKECACTTIASLVGQPSNVNLFLQSNSVKILAPLILDDKLAIRKHALGALRNMTVSGNCYANCEEMVKQDIMTPLVVLLQKFVHEVQDETFLKISENIDMFSQAVHLLWNICENSEVAVKIFNQQSLCRVLLTMLKTPVNLPSSLLLPTLQCLYSVSESNSTLCQELLPEQTIFYKYVNKAYETAEELLIQMTSLGILWNILSGTNDIESSIIDEVNMKTAALTKEVLLIEVEEMLSQSLVSLEKMKTANVDYCMMPLEKENNQASGENINDENHDSEMDDEMNANGFGDCASEAVMEKEQEAAKRPTPKMMISYMDMQAKLEKELKEVENIVLAQQIAVEIIANICSTDDDDDWEDVESTDENSDESSMETNLCEQPIGGNQDYKGDKVINKDIAIALLGKCSNIKDKLTTSLSGHKLAHPVIRSLKQLQCYSLLCLSNVIAIPSISEGNDMTLMGNIWEKLGELFAKYSAPDSMQNNEDLVEAITSALRSVLQRISDVEPSMVNKVTEDDLKYICSVAQCCKLAEIRAHIVRVVGCIGCALAKQPEPHIYLKGIGIFFCDICSQEKELWIIAECLDCIFDVFGEDHLNGIIKEIELLEKLKSMVPVLKVKVQEQKKSLGEHAVIVNTAKNNLPRFIKYKSALIK